MKNTSCTLSKPKKMISNDQNLYFGFQRYRISDFVAYFTSLGTAIFKEEFSRDIRENSSP